MKRPKRGTAGKMGANLSGLEESPEQKIDRKSFIKKLAVKREIDGIKSAYVSTFLYFLAWKSEPLDRGS